MLSRQCCRPGRLKAQSASSGLFINHQKYFHAAQAHKADRAPSGGNTRRAASAAASRDIQNLRSGLDLRNQGARRPSTAPIDLRSQGVKRPPAGAPIVRGGGVSAAPRGARITGKLVRSQRDGGDRSTPGFAEPRSSFRPSRPRTPRDAPFQHGPRRINMNDGPGNSSFKGRSRQTFQKRSPRQFDNEAITDDEDEDLDEDVYGDLGDSSKDGDVDEGLKDAEFTRLSFADQVAIRDNEADDEESSYLTGTEQAEAVNDETWVRLECATMEPIPEALPTFTPAEITAESLLKGRTTLPIGNQGLDQMVELQMKRATKRSDYVTTNLDWARRRFRKGELVAFDSEAEMNAALYLRDWEVKAKQMLTGEHVTFRDAAEREAVDGMVTGGIIEAVQARHPDIAIETREDLGKDGIKLELFEFAALNRLAFAAGDEEATKDPEQAEIMRSIFNVSTMTAEERKEAEEKYGVFIPVDKTVRDSVMSKMVAGKYSLGDETGVAAAAQSLAVNNGSYLPHQERSLLDKVKSYMPQSASRNVR